MFKKLDQWNQKVYILVCILIGLGILFSAPIIYQRHGMEKENHKVEMVLDYRDLLEVAVRQPDSNDFIDERLRELKEQGITTVAMYESTLEELQQRNYLQIFEETELRRNGVLPLDESRNHTYVAFTRKEYADIFSPIIRERFQLLEYEVGAWEFQGKSGLVLHLDPEEATAKPMQPDPIMIKKITDLGLIFLPRLTDAVPYHHEVVEKEMATLRAAGAKRVLFDGMAVKGFADNQIQHFSQVLKENHMGIVAIEGMKEPQKGFNRLAAYMNYDVVRLHSLLEEESNLPPDVLAARFELAVKDRNIRMIFLNVAVRFDATTAKLENTIQNVAQALGDQGHAIDRIQNNGFEFSEVVPFKYESSMWKKITKGFLCLAGVAFCAVLVRALIPTLFIPALGIGLIGTAALYVLSSTWCVQLLSLGVGIAAPSIAMIYVIKRTRSGVVSWSKIFATYIKAALISLIAAPLIIGLLDHISYNLMLQQFRGVGALHIIPIIIVAVYLCMTEYGSLWTGIRKILMTKVTLLMIAGLACVGGILFYYLNRTGNGGQVSSYELLFRNILENTFGVRPRTKEFLLTHPVFLWALFLRFDYAKAKFLYLFALIGQISMVSTFTHLHTPIMISCIRVALGLFLGACLGLVLIGAWKIVERNLKLCMRKLVKR